MKVHGRIETIPSKKIDNLIFVEGAKWANVDIPSAKKSLASFVDYNPTNLDKFRQSIRNKYSFANVASKYDKFFKRWK